MRTRPKPQSRRPVSTDSVEEFFAQPQPSTRREPLDRRGSRGRRGIVVAIVAAVVVVAGIVAALMLTMPSIGSLEPTGVTNNRTPQLDFAVSNPYALSASKVDASVDGRAIDADAISVTGGDVSIESPKLADGRHEVAVTVDGVGVLRLAMHHSWTITVDTAAPKVRTTGPVPATADTAGAYDQVGVVTVTKQPIVVTAKTEAGAGFSLASSREDVEPVKDGVSDETTRTAKITLPQGAQELLVRSTDPAGNTGVQRIPVMVDTTGPAILGTVPVLVKDARLGLELRTTDAHGTRMQVQVDGKDIEDGDLQLVRSTQPGRAGTASVTTDAPAAQATPATPAGGPESPVAAAIAYSSSDATLGGPHSLDLSGPAGAPTTVAEVASSDDAAAADTTAAAATEPAADASGAADEDQLPIAATYLIKLQEPLYEGRHTMQLTTRDSLGSSRTIKRAFIVDAAETLDAAAGIKGGARGKDVTALQAELIKQQLTTKLALGTEFTGRTYGLRTKAAVQKLQQSKGVEADGVAGADTLAALTLKLVVDRATHTLTLYRSGAVVKTWGVAVGSPQYPTPAGSFKIQSMQENPTWTPPDSVWAKGAKVIGPGPDNPLGTRWMGINGTVGIHGTNSPASIGFSVSHGCIRMRIPDVEDVFSRVRVGTPVEVR